MTLTLTLMVIMKTVTGLWLPHLIDENSGKFVCSYTKSLRKHDHDMKLSELVKIEKIILKKKK